MSNEDIQKTILCELKNFQKDMQGFKEEMQGFKEEMQDFKEEMQDFKEDIIEQLDELKISQKQFGVRQDEMYQVLRAIEHSNNAGKAELDSQNLRVSKIEGKLKRVSKTWQEDTDVSNL